MSQLAPLKAFAEGMLGKRVDRVTATLPQTAAAALFTIAGGKVAITGIIGEVTTIIETQLTNTKLTANPTTGTSLDICAVLDISADEVGAQYGITGLFSEAMVGNVAGATVLPRNPAVLNVGTLDLDCGASSTGSVKWSIFYVPLEDGATVTAA